MVRYSKAVASGKATNLAGGEAYKESPELELVQLLLTSMLQDKYYRTATDERKRLEELCHEVDPIFAAKAAVYARHVFGMRSASHVATAEIGRVMSDAEHSRDYRGWLEDFYDTVIRRPDDMREIVALTFGGPVRQRKGTGHALPCAMRRGFRSAFRRFDAYQLGAYRGEKAGVSLIDIVRLCHVKPMGKCAEALAELVAGTLRSQKQTAKLTQVGQKAESAEQKKEMNAAMWGEELERMGYYAAIANARSILRDAPELATRLGEKITNAEVIRRSLVMPLEIYRAYQSLSENRDGDANLRAVMASLSLAIDLALPNLPDLPGRTLVALDGSGSMTTTVRGGPFMKSSVSDVATLFAAILAKRYGADVIVFSNDSKYVQYNPSDSTITLAQHFHRNSPGGGTDMNTVFRRANKPYDRVIILSDMQSWVESSTPVGDFNEYKRKFNLEKVRVFSFDLAGYGTTQFSSKETTCIAGLNFGVFDLLAKGETDAQALLKEVQDVRFTQEWVKSVQEKQHGR